GIGNQSIPSQLPDPLRLATQTDRADPGDRSQRRSAFRQILSLEQIRNSLFGYDMGNVVSIDHDGRHREPVPFAHFNGVERFNKRRYASFGVSFHQLDYQLPSSHDLAIGVDKAQPRRSAMATAMRLMPH